MSSASTGSEMRPGSLPKRSAVRRLLYWLSTSFGGRGRRGRLTTLAFLASAAMLMLVLVPLALGLSGGLEWALLGFVVGCLCLAVVVLIGLVLGIQRMQLKASAAVRRAELRTEKRIELDGTFFSGAIADVVARLDKVQTAAQSIGNSLSKVPVTEPATRRQLTNATDNIASSLQATMNLFAMVSPAAAVPAMTGYVAAPDLVTRLVEEVWRLEPRIVVETGSGVSTLFMALAVRQRGLATRIISLEHDARYAQQTRELLERHGVADLADVRFAPLAAPGLPGHETEWYSVSALEGIVDVGMVLVDGPPEKVGPQSRYPAIPLLADRLAVECTIFVDDTARKQDREVAERWKSFLPNFSFEELPLLRGLTMMKRQNITN